MELYAAGIYLTSPLGRAIFCDSMLGNRDGLGAARGNSRSGPSKSPHSTTGAIVGCQRSAHLRDRGVAGTVPIGPGDEELYQYAK